MTIMIEKEFVDGVHYLYNLAEDKTLCYSNREKGSIESRISLPTTDIVASYLILTFTRSYNIDMVKWKISFNDVILTRELKPHIEKPVDEKHIQSIFVYDVSKIMIKNEASIRVSCTAKGYISLEGATLLAVMRYKGFNTYVTCEVDPHIINDIVSKSYNILPSFEPNEAVIHLGLIAPTSSWIEVKTDQDIVKKLNVVKGYNLVEVSLNKNLLRNIEIRNTLSQGLKYLFSCASLRYTEYPDIVVEDVHVENSLVKLRLKNIGNSYCDTLDLLILRYGVPIHKISLSPLKPNEYLEQEVDLNNVTRHATVRVDNLTLRIIWSKAHRLFEYDIPIKTLNIV